jgi:hypothetical protein
MKSPIKDLRFVPKSLGVLRDIIPEKSFVDSYLLYSGDIEINLAESNRYVVSHTNSFIVYDFWRALFHSPEIITQMVDHFWPIEDEKLFEVYQTRFRTYTDHLMRASLFFILNRCSSEGMIQSGILKKENFNPLAVSYIKRFKKINFDVMWDKQDNFVDTVTGDTDADYLYFPIGKFSYNFLDDGINRGFEETRVQHKKLFKKLNNLDKKIILDYIYHPHVAKMYQSWPTKIFLNEYGQVVEQDMAKEIIIANY